MKIKTLKEIKKMKKGIMTIALIAVLALIATPVFADTPTTYRVDTSANMTVWAWDCLLNENYTGAIGWAKRCIYFWGPRALDQFTKHGALDQAKIDAATAKLPWNIPTDISKTSVFYPIFVERWALNDVAACHFIAGEAYRMTTPMENLLWTIQPTI